MARARRFSLSDPVATSEVTGTSGDLSAPLPPLDPPDEDQAAAEEAAALNDDLTTDFSAYIPSPITVNGAHPNPLLGGLFGGDSSGTGANTIPLSDGTPTSVPMIAHARTQPGVQQLRIWKIDRGQRVLVGTCPHDITEENFIETFLDDMPRVGDGPVVFVMRPMDRGGREVGSETLSQPFSPTHVLLKQIRLRASATAGSPVSFLPGPTPVDSMMPFIRDQIREAATLRREQNEALDRQREDMHRVREEAAKIISSNGERAASAVESITERLMSTEAARSAAALQQMQQQSRDAIDAADRRSREDSARREEDRKAVESRAERSILDQEARIERERMNMQVTIDRERADWDRRRAAEQDDYQRRRDRDRDEANAAETKREREAIALESRRDREHALALAAIERDEKIRVAAAESAAQRDREHAARLHELTMARMKESTGSNFIEQGTKMLAAFGMTPADILGRVTGDAAGSTLVAAIPEIGAGVRELISGVKDVIKSGIDARSKEQEGVQRAAVEQARMQALTGGPTYVVGNGQAQLPGPTSSPVVNPVPEAPASVQPAPTPVPVAAPVSAPPASTLSLGVLKEARNGLRQLVATLKNTPQDQWEDRIFALISGTPEVRTYAQESGLRTVLREANADATMIETVVQHISAHPVIRAAGIALNLG